MYSMMIKVNSYILSLKVPKRADLKCSHWQIESRQLCRLMNVLFNHIVAITSQYNVHQIILYTLNLLYISYISLKVQIFFLKNSIINSCHFNSVFSSTQMVKNLLAMRETWVWSLGQEDHLEKGMTTHSSILT